MNQTLIPLTMIFTNHVWKSSAEDGSEVVFLLLCVKVIRQLPWIEFLISPTAHRHTHSSSIHPGKLRKTALFLVSNGGKSKIDVCMKCTIILYVHVCSVHLTVDKNVY